MTGHQSHYYLSKQSTIVCEETIEESSVASVSPEFVKRPVLTLEEQHKILRRAAKRVGRDTVKTLIEAGTSLVNIEFVDFRDHINSLERQFPYNDQDWIVITSIAACPKGFDKALDTVQQEEELDELRTLRKVRTSAPEPKPRTFNVRSQEILDEYVSTLGEYNDACDESARKANKTVAENLWLFYDDFRAVILACTLSIKPLTAAQENDVVRHINLAMFLTSVEIHVWSDELEETTSKLMKELGADWTTEAYLLPPLDGIPIPEKEEIRKLIRAQMHVLLGIFIRLKAASN